MNDPMRQCAWSNAIAQIASYLCGLLEEDIQLCDDVSRGKKKKKMRIVMMMMMMMSH